MRVGEGFSFSLAGMAAGAASAQGNVVTDATSGAQGLAVDSASVSRTNMLENNFVHSGTEQSRYLTGLIDSFKIESEFRNKMQGIFTLYADLAAQADSYAQKGLVGQQAANAVQDLKDEEVSEKMGEKLEESREEMEEKIDEKQAETEGLADDGTVADAETEIVDTVEQVGNIQETAEQQAESAPVGLQDSLMAQNAAMADGDIATGVAGIDIMV